MEDKAPDSDIVELIIAVDLDPKNPSEPINVTSVDANEGKGKGQCQMCAKLFKVMGKMNPEMDAVANSSMDDEEKLKAMEKLAAAEPSEDQEEADSFDKARDRKPERDSEERYGNSKPEKGWKPKPPREEGDFGDKPKFDDKGEGDFEPKKKSGGFQGASDRAFDKKPQSDFESDEDEDEDFKPKKRW